MVFGSSIKIRQFEAPDLIPLHRMIQETIEISYGKIYPVRAVQFFKRFHSEKTIEDRSRTGVVLVLENGSSIPATGTLLEDEIVAVFVSSPVQRCGYGKAIMEELETRARAKGITEIHLSISLPSRQFYENMGYDVLEKRSLDVGEGQFLDYWPARKKL